MKKWLKRIVLGLLALVALLVGIGLSSQAILSNIDQGKYTPPGQLVDVGGFKLHLHCTGHGSPTVILDTGLGVPASSWALVQREVAKTTRICSYDRAGYGFSEPGPLSRTSERIAEELHALLAAAGEKGPFVLAGHSFGGLNVRLFEHAYPSEVSGMVLIDSAAEEALGSELWRPLYSPYESDAVLMLGRFLARLGVARILLPDLLKDTGFSPEEKAIIRAQSLSTTCAFAFMDEFHTLPQSFREAQKACGPIGSKPLVVIVAGKSPDYEAIAGSKDKAEIMKNDWILFQKNLAKLSTTLLIWWLKVHIIFPWSSPRL